MSAWRWAVTLATMTVVVVALPTLARTPGAAYGSQHGLLALEAGAALALLVVAATSLRAAAAVPTMIAAATWLVPELAGLAVVDLRWRTLAEAWTDVLPSLVVLGVVLQRRPGRARAHLLLLGAVASLAAAVARVVLVDPFQDGDCWRACATNPLLMVGSETAGGLVHSVLVVVAGAALAWALAAEAVVRRPRPVAAWALAGALLVGSFGRVLGGERADDPGWSAWFVIVQAAAVLWLATVLVDGWQRRSLAARLTALLGDPDDDQALSGVTPALREAVGDPSLEIAYADPTRSELLDVTGAAIPARRAPRRAVTILTRTPGAGLPAETVAVVEHADRVDGERLRRALGPALTLVLANEQLRAISLAELDELRRSRARVVERASLERSRLERNLHDGAQQGVVALSLLLRALGQRLAAGPAGPLARATALCAATLEELRRVARGLYPAVLSDAGLEGALRELAEGSRDLPVEVAETPITRCSGTVESTAYLVVQASLEAARRRGATVAVVRCVVNAGRLTLTVADDAPAPDPPVDPTLLDQVVALGGRLEVRPRGPGTLNSLELPCGS